MKLIAQSLLVLVGLAICLCSVELNSGDKKEKFYCFASKREKKDNHKWEMCSQPMLTNRGRIRGISDHRLFKTSQRCCDHNDAMGFTQSLRMKRRGLYICDVCPVNSTAVSAPALTSITGSIEEVNWDVDTSKIVPLLDHNGSFEINTTQLSFVSNDHNSTTNSTENDLDIINLSTPLHSGVTVAPPSAHSRNAVHGGWGEWNPNGICSVTCGDGQQSLVRVCNNPPPSNGGRQCKGQSTTTLRCDGIVMACPVDGGWSAWMASSCSKTCGIGLLAKYRCCNNPSPANGGQLCEGKHSVAEKCWNEMECPVDGGWTFWSKKSDCILKSAERCGEGFTRRTRSCRAPEPRFDGLDCDGSTQMFEKCVVSCCNIYEPGKGGCLPLEGSGDSDDEN